MGDVLINADNMKKSIDAVTYIEKTLFSYIFDFDSSTELWLTENIKKGCPHIWSDENRRMITNRFFDWWMKYMPYVYEAMIEDKKFIDVLYNTVKMYAESDADGTFDRFIYDDNHNVLKSKLCVGNEFHVDFTKFNGDLYIKLLSGFQNSMKVLVPAGDVIDTLVNSLTPSKRYQISYVVCNFMYLLVAVMHDDKFCDMIEHIGDYYKMVCEAHYAKYNKDDDNPDDFI